MMMMMMMYMMMVYMMMVMYIYKGLGVWGYGIYMYIYKYIYAFEAVCIFLNCIFLRCHRFKVAFISVCACNYFPSSSVISLLGTYIQLLLYSVSIIFSY